MGAGQPSDLKWLQDTPEETLTDIQRAARFYYLQKQTFGGKVADHIRYLYNQCAALQFAAY